MKRNNNRKPNPENWFGQNMNLSFVRNYRSGRVQWMFLIFLCSAEVVLSLSQCCKWSRNDFLGKARDVCGLRFCNRETKVSPQSSTALLVASQMDPSWSSSNTDDPLFEELEGMQRNVYHGLRGNNYTMALDEITRMTLLVRRKARTVHHKGMSAVVDEAIRAFTDRAFANPIRSRAGRQRIQGGMEAIQLQLSPTASLAAPYNTVPRSTLLNALKALTGTIGRDDEHRGRANGFSAADSSFRILQRLVTGVGVRGSDQQKSFHVLERDFNMVLNAFSNVGRMDMAHKTVALQERTPHAPPLSPVAYSILLKGYGRLRDLENVEMTIAHAHKKTVEPDTVMLNSLIDAYVNCNAVQMAQDVFQIMKDPQHDGISDAKHTDLLVSNARPHPNLRTYNTLLKGLAKEGAFEEAMAISKEMEVAQLWDHVTTNTLVSAAVTVGKFEVAEDLLTNFTAQVQPNNRNSNNKRTRTRRQHPNVEAYTELLDGYAKAGMLDKSLRTLQLMLKRDVEPSIVTYTSIVGNLAKAKKLGQANSMMEFMKSKGARPTVVTYNAYISGLVSDPPVKRLDGNDRTMDAEKFNSNVDKAVALLSRMMKSGIQPNSITVSVLIDALGRCNPPRLDEAKALISRLEDNRIKISQDKKAETALINCCGASGDLKGALDVFREMRNPDVIALNAFMDACCRCGQMKLAFDTFQHFFSKQGRMIPDVISYSVLIAALLKRKNTSAADKARQLYNEMRDQRIQPDTALVDIILTAMVKGGRLGLRKREIKFALNVLRDAERLEWEVGQLERRKRAVRGVLVGRMSDVWKQDEELYGMVSAATATDAAQGDDLLKRKGWNQVDSGFRLWGGGEALEKANRKDPPGKVVDEFLASKGWNDVDSGFRII